jgi:hypothetical protein
MLVAPVLGESELREALQEAILESVLAGLHPDDVERSARAVELYLRAHWLYMRAHDLPVEACCELGDILSEIARNLGLPEADPKAIALFTRCHRCSMERGSHAADAPHGIEDVCEGWDAP